MSWIKYSFQIKEGLELVVGMRSAPTEENRFVFFFFFIFPAGDCIHSWLSYILLVFVSA